MPPRSKINRLPAALKKRIGELWDAGATLDQILQALGSVDVSRSALGRHIQQRERLVERLRRSREIADSVVQNLGDKNPGKTQAILIESLHSIIFDMFSGENAEQSIETLQASPKGMSMLADAIHSLARAQRLDVDVRADLEKRAREKAEREAKEAVTLAARKEGLSAETVRGIMAEAFGAKS